MSVIRPWLRNRVDQLRPVDWMVVVYVLAVTLLVAIRAPELPGWPWLLLAHGLILVLVLLVHTPGMGRTGVLLRELYPIVLLAGFYSELDVLNAGRPVYDALVQQWEATLFGGQPSRDWWRAMPSAAASFLLHATYFAYYPMILMPAVWLAARGRLPALRRFVFGVMAAFIFCYLVFLILPVAGPYYEFSRPTGSFVSNPAARLVYATLSQGSSYGAAFPSSHVAATIAALIGVWAASRRAGMLMLAPALLLPVAVVYCQMHYAVDAVSGVLVGVAAGWIGLKSEGRAD